MAADHQQYQVQGQTLVNVRQRFRHCTFCYHTAGVSRAPVQKY